MINHPRTAIVLFLIILIPIIGQARNIRDGCGPCQLKIRNQCVTCKRAGMDCIMGRCENKGKMDCPPCNVRKGKNCVHCSFLGLKCHKGRCLTPEELARMENTK
jgi:hypothetical protein